MRAGPSNASSPASALIWLTTPPTTVSGRPQGNASTHTSSPSLAISLRFTAGSTMPSATSSVTSASGLDATTTSFVRSLRPGAVRWICWVVGGSRKWRAVTIHEGRVTACDATTTPHADRRPPPSRSHRSWTVDGRIFRMTSSRVVSAPLEAHPEIRRVRAATPTASLMRAHSDREHPGRQMLSSAKHVDGGAAWRAPAPAGQRHDRSSDRLWPDEAGALPRRGAHRPTRQLGVDEPRADRPHTDAGAGQLGGECLRQADDAELGRAVGDVLPDPLLAELRRHVDDQVGDVLPDPLLAELRRHVDDRPLALP